MKSIRSKILFLIVILASLLVLSSCSEIDALFEPTIKKHTHRFGAWYGDTATCTEGGVERRDCEKNDCVHFETRNTAPLGHDEIQNEGKTPTCTEGGWDAYVTCSRCDYSTRKDKPAAAHDRGADKVCTVCGELIYSKGLEFKYNGDGTATLSEIGDCTDEFIFIPKETPAGHAVTAIGAEAFYRCYDITGVEIPETVTTIEKCAFYFCDKLTSIVFDGESALEIIDEQAFYNCDSLTGVDFPDSLISIGKAAFENCNELAEISFGEDSKLEVFGTYAFFDCDKLLSFDFPKNLIKIKDHAFCECDMITRITIPENVTTIESFAFCDCDRLMSVEILGNVTSIGASAFEFCYRLVEVINKSDLANSRYKKVSLYAIEVHNGESKIDRDGDFLFYVNGGKNYLFAYTGSDTEVLLPENYNGESYGIHNYAFYKYENMTGVTIPSGVTSIGSSAFRDCSALTDIKIPESVTFIGDFAFYSCFALNEITFEISDGWWYATEPDATSGTAVDEMVISDHAAAAKYFKSTHCAYFWHRK